MMLRKLLYSGLAVIGLLAGGQNASAASTLFACQNNTTGLLILYSTAPTACQPGWTLTTFALATDTGRTGPYQILVTGELPAIPAVPPGKRLVIQNITARAFLSGTALGMLKFQFFKVNTPGLPTFFFPMTFAGTEQSAGNLWVGSFPTLMYMDAGVAGQFILEAPFQSPSIQATVTGFLLDCATVPCDPIAP